LSFFQPDVFYPLHLPLHDHGTSSTKNFPMFPCFRPMIPSKATLLSSRLPDYLPLPTPVLGVCFLLFIFLKRLSLLFSQPMPCRIPYDYFFLSFPEDLRSSRDVTSFLHALPFPLIGPFFFPVFAGLLLCLSPLYLEEKSLLSMGF